MSTPMVRTRELSARERQVIRGMALGFTNLEIGERLGLKEETVKTHVRKIYAKLEARSRAHAVHLAWEQGILTRT